MRFKNWRKKILNFLSEDSTKTVIFINMQEHLDKVALLVKEIARKAKSKILVVCFNSEPPVYFQKTNLNLKLSEDYLTDADYKYIDEYAINLARTWYLVKDKNGKGVTEYENIHLGSLVEYDFKQFLILHIKNFEVVKRVIDLENPHKIITMEDTGELKDVVKTVSRDNNISLLSFSNKPLFSSLIALKKRIRDKLSDVFYLSLVDSIMRILLIKTKLNNLILIDPRAHAMLTGPHQLESFIFCPLEKGLSNRLYALKKGKMYISFDTPLSGRLKKQIYEQKNKFLTKWDELSRNASFMNKFIYKDIGIWGLIEGVIFKFFKERFPRILRRITQVKEFHKHNTIKSIALRADMRETEKTIVMTSEQLNIPTLYITHGVIAENVMIDRLYCTKIAVWGQADFERYISFGNSPDKLVITGNPKYDRLHFKRFNISKELIYKKLGLNCKKPFITFATQPNVGKFSSYRIDDEREIVLRNVLSAILGIPDIQLVIKLHPFEDFSMYKRVLKETNPKDVVLVRNIDIFALIDASILLMTYRSTVGLEAMILNKPVITINLEKRKDILPFAAGGAAVGVYRSVDIGPAIERVLKDQALNKQMEAKRREMVSYYIYKLDGRASERVVKLINMRRGNNQLA